MAYGANNSGFMIKSYDDLLKENSFTTKKMVDNIGDPSCPSSNDDILSFNAHPMQSNNVSKVAVGFLNTLHNMFDVILISVLPRIHQVIFCIFHAFYD